MDSPSSDDAPPLWVICLCAGWCNVCRDWQPAFDAAAREHPQHRFAWVDVEDEDEAMGDLDIETFPTILIARGDRALFLGAIQPSGGHLSRLVTSLAHPATTSSAAPEAHALVTRLQAGVLPKV